MADNFNQPERDVVLDLIRRDNPGALVPSRHITFSAPIDAAPATGRNTLIDAAIRGFREPRTFFYDRLTFSDFFADKPPVQISHDATVPSILAAIGAAYDLRLEESDLHPVNFSPDPVGGIQTMEMRALSTSLVYRGSHVMELDVLSQYVFEDMLGDVSYTFNTLIDHYLGNIVTAARQLNDHYLGNVPNDRELVEIPPVDDTPVITGDYFLTNETLAARTSDFRTFEPVTHADAPRLMVERSSLAAGDRNRLFAISDESADAINRVIRLHISQDTGDTWASWTVPGFRTLGRGAVFFKGAYFVPLQYFSNSRGHGVFRLDAEKVHAGTITAEDVHLVCDVTHNNPRVRVVGDELMINELTHFWVSNDGVAWTARYLTTGQPQFNNFDSPFGNHIYDFVHDGTNLHVLVQDIESWFSYHHMISRPGSKTQFSTTRINHWALTTTEVSPSLRDTKDFDLAIAGDYVMLAIGHAPRQWEVMDEVGGGVLVKALNAPATTEDWTVAIKQIGMQKVRIVDAGDGVVISGRTIADPATLTHLGITEPHCIAFSSDNANGWRRWAFEDADSELAQQAQSAYHTVRVEPEDLGPYDVGAILPVPGEMLPRSFLIKRSGMSYSMDMAAADDGRLMVIEPEYEYDADYYQKERITLVENFVVGNDYEIDDPKQYSYIAEMPRRNFLYPVALANGWIAYTPPNYYTGATQTQPDWITRYRLDGTLVDVGFTPPVFARSNGQVVTITELVLSVDRNRLFVRGNFDRVDGRVCPGLAAINPMTGALDEAFNVFRTGQQMAGRIYPLASGRLVVASSTGTQALRIFSATGTSAASTLPTTLRDVVEVSHLGGDLIVITTHGGIERWNVAGTTRNAAFNTYMTSTYPGGTGVQAMAWDEAGTGLYFFRVNPSSTNRDQLQTLHLAAGATTLSLADFQINFDGDAQITKVVRIAGGPHVRYALSGTFFVSRKMGAPRYRMMELEVEGQETGEQKLIQFMRPSQPVIEPPTYPMNTWSTESFNQHADGARFTNDGTTFGIDFDFMSYPYTTTYSRLTAADGAYFSLEFDGAYQHAGVGVLVEDQAVQNDMLWAGWSGQTLGVYNGRMFDYGSERAPDLNGDITVLEFAYRLIGRKHMLWIRGHGGTWWLDGNPEELYNPTYVIERDTSVPIGQLIVAASIGEQHPNAHITLHTAENTSGPVPVGFTAGKWNGRL